MDITQDNNETGIPTATPLSPWEQYKNIEWYISTHYPWSEISTPQQWDIWAGRLPERLTHAAMMQLGSAVDHRIFILDPTLVIEEHRIYRNQDKESTALPVYAIAHAQWGPHYRDMFWLPHLATIASLTNCEIWYGSSEQEISTHIPSDKAQEPYVVIDYNNYGNLFSSTITKDNKEDSDNTDILYGREIRPHSGIILATPETLRQSALILASRIEGLHSGAPSGSRIV